jgi:uncharacterized protein YihD (DUF1040 family)
MEIKMEKKRLNDIISILEETTNNRNRIKVMEAVIELVKESYFTGFKHKDIYDLVSILEDAKVIL